MSATVTSQDARQPAIPFGGLLTAAMLVIALAAVIGIGAALFVRDTSPAIQFDPTGAQRVHLVREYGSAASYDASGALQTHMLRENDAAPAGTIYDHVVRENGTN